MSALEMCIRKRSVILFKFPHLNMKYGISYTFVLMILSTTIAEVERPRGVSISSKYMATKNSGTALSIFQFSLRFILSECQCTLFP